jgi:enamine deaminase RidA (YjgF/YER057c/UK114 family)
MKAIWPPKTPEGLVFTPAYAMEPETQLVFLSCVTPLRNGRVDESIEAQTNACLANLRDALRELGPGARAVKTTRLMTDVREVWDTQRPFDEAFGQWQPTSTLLEVPVCSVEGARIEFDFWAMVPPPPSGSGVKRPIAGEAGVPRAVCVSGTARLHVIVAEPEAGARGAERELAACLDVVERRMAAAASSLSDVVKLTLYLTDMRIWPGCLNAIRQRFGESCPALTPVAVGKLSVPGRSIALDAWAATPNDPAHRAAAADNAASIDMRGPLLIISGEGAIPIYVGGKAADIYKYRPDADIRDQARVSMENYKAILDAARTNWNNVFKTTWYVTDNREWDAIRPVAEKYFGRPVPAPTVVDISKLVLPGLRFEPDMWATLPS